MIKGLYEAHLPVKNIEVSIEFYRKLGLKFAWHDEDTAFFWIEEEKSWLVRIVGRKGVPNPIPPIFKAYCFSSHI